MALRISKRSWRRADSRARCCAHFTLEMATPARMPMIVMTTISSTRVKPFDLRRVMGAPGEKQKAKSKKQKYAERTRRRREHFCFLLFAFYFSQSPFVVVRLSVERHGRGGRVHFEHVVGRADARGVGVVVVAEDLPFRLPGHRVDEVAL